MRINNQLLNSYKANNQAFNLGKKKNSSVIQVKSNSELRDMRRGLTGNANREEQYKPNSIIADSLNYAEKLRTQRMQGKNTSLQKKKLRYQYKDISSKIVRSKTSTMARQAVSQAKREIQRLKSDRASGKYDLDDIEAAITHAKSMERIARKKVKHLEQEELAKASGKMSEEVESAGEDKLESIEDNRVTAGNEEIIQNSDVEKTDIDFTSDLDISAEADLASAINVTNELMDELAQGTQEMLEDMGLDELGAVAALKDMDQNDLKKLEVKHRTQEMKEIVKADMEYLKSVFDKLAKLEGTSSASPAVGSSAGVDAMAAATGTVVAPVSSPMPVIDISL